MLKIIDSVHSMFILVDSVVIPGGAKLYHCPVENSRGVSAPRWSPSQLRHYTRLYLLRLIVQTLDFWMAIDIVYIYQPPIRIISDLIGQSWVRVNLHRRFSNIFFFFSFTYPLTIRHCCCTTAHPYCQFFNFHIARTEWSAETLSLWKIRTYLFVLISKLRRTV